MRLTLYSSIVISIKGGASEEYISKLPPATVGRVKESGGESRTSGMLLAHC